MIQLSLSSEYDIRRHIDNAQIGADEGDNIMRTVLAKLDARDIAQLLDCTLTYAYDLRAGKKPIRLPHLYSLGEPIMPWVNHLCTFLNREHPKRIVQNAEEENAKLKAIIKELHLSEPFVQRGIRFE